MRNYALIAAVLLFVPFTADAQEYLDPEQGVYSSTNAGYQNRIREVFAEGYRSVMMSC